MAHSPVHRHVGLLAGETFHDAVARLEEVIFEDVLEQSETNAEAWNTLGLSRRTFYRVKARLQRRRQR